MADATTIGILRDLTFFVSLATALGIAGYWLLRHYRPQVSWNQEGLVPSRPYGWQDLLLVAALGLTQIYLMQTPAGDNADAGVTSAAIVAGMVFQLIVCIGLLLYLSRLRGLNPAELFGLQHLHWRSMFKVVLIFALICLTTVLFVAYLTNDWLKQIWPDIKPQSLVSQFQDSKSLGFKMLIVVTAVVVAPLAEEIIFRGLVYGVLKRYTDAPFAALSSSLMFAIVHMHIGSLMPLWVLAVLFCIAYEISGSLLVPMLLHMIFNGTSILLMLFMDPSTVP